MRAVVAQELDVAVLRQPVVVVQHDGVGRAVTKGQEFGEDLFDAVDIGLNGFVGQLRTRGVLSGRVADAGSAAAHENHRLMARLLKAAQHHDLNQRTHVQ